MLRLQASFFDQFLNFKTASVAVFFLALAIFGVSFLHGQFGDTFMHVGFLQRFLIGKYFFANFLYYLTVLLIGLFQNNKYILLLASGIVLSLAVAAKFYLTGKFLFESWHEFAGDARARRMSIVSAFSLLLVFNLYLPPIPGVSNYFYLGNLPPNVWHNSTMIFLMPFALALFWYSARRLNAPHAGDVWLLTLLVALNVFAKPSFFFCFGVVFPILSLLRFRLKRDFWLSLIPVCAGFILIWLQYLVIYQFSAFDPNAEKADVIIAPFLVWNFFSVNIPVSVLISTAFPLAYLIFYPLRVSNQKLLYYAYWLFVVAVALMILLAETGFRQRDGNFFWQAFICNYLLFFAVTRNFVGNLLISPNFKWRDYLLIILFLLHVVSGVFYLSKYPFN